MPFNITDFKGNFPFDGARPNLFEVNIPVFDRKLVFTAKSAQLPGSSLGSIDIPYFGRMIKVAGNRIFPEWTITVINDEDFVVRNQLEEWMSRINGHESNLAEAFYSQYTFDAEVYQFGKQGNILKTYTFIDMFPTDISAIEVGWDQNDQIEEYAVTFQYQYWTSPEVFVA
jgi:hypothetical protein